MLQNVANISTILIQHTDLSTSTMPPPRGPLHGNLSNDLKHHNASSSSRSGTIAPRVKFSKVLLPLMVLVALMWMGFLAQKYRTILLTASSTSTSQRRDELPQTSMKQRPNSLSHPSSSSHDNKSNPRSRRQDNPNLNAPILALPAAFMDVLYRAREKSTICRNLHNATPFPGFDKSNSVPFGHTNETLAALPTFGIIEDIEGYVPNPSTDSQWKCVKPSRKECTETQFSVVFMAYNPDRLKVTLNQIQLMLEDPQWSQHVRECIIVWNGERSVNESDIGKVLLNYAAQHPDTFRIEYPLKMGLPNDLMNRYHPHVVKPQTAALLYYDDDGPFYAFDAVIAGFELWKRHASAQVGAMAREISLGPRQAIEHATLSINQHDDRLFVSHCDNLDDQVDYNFRYFANYDANMVLPSGSFLHSQYLCYLWHPVLEPIRQFVRAHPTHPDDMTVSLVVSQLGGRAPRVYSRRLNKATNPQKSKPEKRRRLHDADHRLLEEQQPYDSSDQQRHELEALLEEDPATGIIPVAEQMRRKLLFSIQWDVDNQKMTDAKKLWAALRTEAINSLVRYFGSINSGSIGWCEGTEWYNPKKDGKCGTFSPSPYRVPAVLSTQFSNSWVHSCAALQHPSSSFVAFRSDHGTERLASVDERGFRMRLKEQFRWSEQSFAAFRRSAHHF